MKLVNPISPLGIHIIDVDLLDTSNEEVLTIKRALAEYGLLVFPKQMLTDSQLEYVAEKIGPTGESARKVSMTSSIKTIANLTNLKNESNQTLGFSGNTTDFWHSDQEFRKNPASLSILYCLIASPSGGNTSFASTRVSNLQIEKAELEYLSIIEGTYIPARTHDNAEMVEVSHPLIQVNPITGCKSIYLSENTVRFLRLPEMDSQALKHRLLSHVLSPSNIYSHTWRMGDLILYDNTQLIHRRESFSGLRWLKGVKIYAPSEFFAVPSGRVVDDHPELLYGKKLA